MLEKRADGIPLGTFIRSSLLESGRKVPVDNRQTLAQILAMLGGSAIAANLNEIARLGRLGALPLSPETESEIHQAVADIAEMKAMLMKALRIKEH